MWVLLNQSAMEKQPVLLTTEPSHLPSPQIFKPNISIKSYSLEEKKKDTFKDMLEEMNNHLLKSIKI